MSWQNNGPRHRRTGRRGVRCRAKGNGRRAGQFIPTIRRRWRSEPVIRTDWRRRRGGRDQYSRDSGCGQQRVWRRRRRCRIQRVFLNLRRSGRFRRLGILRSVVVGVIMEYAFIKNGIVKTILVCGGEFAETYKAEQGYDSAVPRPANVGIGDLYHG